MMEWSIILCSKHVLSANHLRMRKSSRMRASTNNMGLEMIAASTFLCWIIIQNERKAQKHDDFHNNLWSAWAFCFADWMTLTLPWWKLDAMTKINRLYAVCCLEIYLLRNLFVCCCCLSEVILFLNGKTFGMDRRWVRFIVVVTEVDIGTHMVHRIKWTMKLEK